jgi:hypothetical protein
VTESTKVRPKNPTLRLARQVAAERLKRSGFITLKSLNRNPQDPAAAPEHTFPQELIRKLAGG